MTEQKPKRYFRITRAERSSIERALKAKKPIARSMAKDLAIGHLHHRGSEAQPGGGQRARQRREGRQGAGGRMREAAALALGVQRVQAVALPLLQEVEMRILRCPRTGALRGAPRAVSRVLQHN